MIKKISLLTALSVTAFSGWAQENNSTQNPSSEKNADDVVVTANRFAQPVSSVLAATTVVTREEIDRWQAKNLTDVMRRLPGVDIEQSGGLGQQSALRIRGSESRHVLILMDGIRLNQAGISGSSDLSQIPLSLVQKIEYIRGARSAVYGSDAIGGVVNIITTREKNGTTLAAGVGSKGYQTYDLATQQILDNGTTVTLAGNYVYTKGFDIAAADAPRQPDRDGFMSKSIYGAVKQQFNDEFSGFLRGYGFDNRTGYDGYDALEDVTWVVLGTPSIRQLYSQTWDTGVQFNRNIYSSQLVASYSHTKDLNFDPAKGRYSPASTLDDVKQYNLQWGNTLAVGAGSVSAGVDWQKQTSQPGTNRVMAGHEQRNAGVYATAQQKISSVTLEGAVRGDDNNAFGWHNTWQSSAAWEFIEGYSIFASYGTAYKAPNLNQVYSEKYGNLNLKPEESKQWEGGFEGLTGLVNWRLSGYRNDIDNLINFDSTNRYSNIQKARIKGAEATASFETGPLAHMVSFDYLDPRNSQTNKMLLRRAKQQVKYQLDWAVADIDWSVTYQYLGQRYDTDYNTFQPVKLGGVSLWDLAASYPVTSHLTVRGRIANLFDKDYETAYGYRTAGREYYLTGSYTF